MSLSFGHFPLTYQTTDPLELLPHSLLQLYKRENIISLYMYINNCIKTATNFQQQHRSECSNRIYCAVTERISENIPTASPGPMIVKMVNEILRSNITSFLSIKTCATPAFSVTWYSSCVKPMVTFARGWKQTCTIIEKPSTALYKI